ncbi:MAG: hypothetical protein ABGX27_08510 [Desulfurobacteriaceae bacterium]
MKQKNHDDIYQAIEEIISEKEKECKIFEEAITKKNPTIIVGNEDYKKKQKASEFLTGLLSAESIQGAKEVVEIYKGIREADAKLAQIYKELELETKKLEVRKYSIEEKSKTFRELIQSHQKQVEFLIQFIEKLPVESEKDFERQLELINRLTNLLDKMLSLTLKYLSI